jgi:hypothetical protein
VGPHLSHIQEGQHTSNDLGAGRASTHLLELLAMKLDFDGNNPLLKDLETLEIEYFDLTLEEAGFEVENTC